MPTYYRLTLIFVLFCLSLSLSLTYSFPLLRSACLTVLVTSFSCLPWLALLSLSLNGAKWKVKDKFRVHFVRRKRLIWECVWLRRKQKKRGRGEDEQQAYLGVAATTLLSTYLPPPLQHCSALASRRVRSNLSLAFCCCCCCGYTGCLALSLHFSFLFPSFLPFTLLLLL